MNRNIKFTFERDIMKQSGNAQLNDNDFIGKSYLIANNIHPNWFPLFKANQYLLCSIFDQLENVTYYPKHYDVFNAFTIDPIRLKCFYICVSHFYKNSILKFFSRLYIFIYCCWTTSYLFCKFIYTRINNFSLV